MEQRVTTIFLKIAIVLIGITSLVFGVFLLPKFTNAVSALVPTAAFFKPPFLICMCTAVIVFLFALYQTTKPLHYIGNGKVFPDASTKTLKNMKIAGTLMVALFCLIGIPAVYPTAQVENAPGLVIIGFGMASMSLIVATFVTVL